MTMRCRTHEGFESHSSSEVLTAEDTVLNSNEYILASEFSEQMTIISIAFITLGEYISV